MRINFSFIEERYDSLRGSLGSVKDQAKRSVSDLVEACSSSSIFQSAKSNYQAVTSWLETKNITAISGPSEQTDDDDYEIVVLSAPENQSQSQVDNPNPESIDTEFTRQLLEAKPLTLRSQMLIAHAREMNSLAMSDGLRSTWSRDHLQKAKRLYEKAMVIDREYPGS